jgi:hypothetical protein
MDASDKIRKIQEITVFQGYANVNRIIQPGVNVSSCATFYTSTIHTYPTYAYKAQIEEGRIYFSTCQGGQ